MTLRKADASTLNRVRSILPAVRAHGIGWLGRQALRVLSEPRRLPGRLWRLGWVLVYLGVLGGVAGGGCLLRRNRRVTLFYDFQVSPVTFDVCWAVATAEFERRRLGLDAIEMVLVPGGHRGYRSEDDEFERVVDIAARDRRVEAILKPVAGLAEGVEVVTHARSRLHATWIRVTRGCAVFPHAYWPALPRPTRPRFLLEQARAGEQVDLPFRASPAALERVETLLGDADSRRLIVVTLRQYSYMPRRNSNLAAWAAFARELDPAVWRIVFVPDTETAGAEPPAELSDFAFMGEASHDLALRMALYERAWLNMMVNNGPHLLCLFNARCRCLMFKLLTEDVPQTTPQFMRFLGFELGQTPTLAARFHRWVWEDDDLPVIRREFARMQADIEACGIPVE